MTIATNVPSDVPEVNKDDAPTPREWELKNTKKDRDAHRRVESHLLHNVKFQRRVTGCQKAAFESKLVSMCAQE